MRSISGLDETNGVLVCSTCHRTIPKGDAFCTRCGAKRNEVRIDMYSYRMMSCIYGPPMKAKYICTKCSHNYLIQGLGGYEDRYCPKCGAKCNTIKLR